MNAQVYRALIALLLVGIVLPAPAAASRAHRSAGDRAGLERNIVETMGHYQSGGRSIAYEQFSLAGGGKRPGVLLIHGADGLQLSPWRNRYQHYARVLAEAGYLVMLPHYFERTGTTWGSWDSIIRNFAVWTRTLADAETALLAEPGAIPGHVRLVGFSLGASEALTLASQDPRVPAVVEFFGAMPDLVVRYMRRMPPTLILHGSADGLVPVKQAYRLEQLLQRKHVPYQMHIYAGQGHGFTGAAEADALRRTMVFVSRY